jgi:hypothetical protein
VRISEMSKNNRNNSKSVQNEVNKVTPEVVETPDEVAVDAVDSEESITPEDGVNDIDSVEETKPVDETKNPEEEKVEETEVEPAKEEHKVVKEEVPIQKTNVSVQKPVEEDVPTGKGIYINLNITDSKVEKVNTKLEKVLNTKIRVKNGTKVVGPFKTVDDAKAVSKYILAFGCKGEIVTE